VVEFGTSFGISTIYLAAAVRDNGTGRVLAYIRDPAHGYLSVAFPESDGLEISCRV
jgi:predicted O-methyltransferase YrrM